MRTNEEWPISSDCLLVVGFANTLVNVCVPAPLDSVDVNTLVTSEGAVVIVCPSDVKVIDTGFGKVDPTCTVTRVRQPRQHNHVLLTRRRM